MTSLGGGYYCCDWGRLCGRCTRTYGLVRQFVVLVTAGWKSSGVEEVEVGFVAQPLRVLNKEEMSGFHDE